MHCSTGYCSWMLSHAEEGPIHGVQWSPSGKEFVVVYGCILPNVHVRVVPRSNWCHLLYIMNVEAARRIS